MKSKWIGTIVCLGAIILATVSFGQETASDNSSAEPPEENVTIDQILQRMEMQYSKRGFTADFVQTSTLKAMDITDTASGKVWIQRPGKMRWEYHLPERHFIITDSRSVWIYRPEENQVTMGRYATLFGDGKGAGFLSDMRLIRKNFEVTRNTDKDPHHYHLVLVPKMKSFELSEVQLSISRKTLQVTQIITRNAYGDETRIDFSAHRFVKDLESTLFSFTIPEYTEVITMGE